MDDPMTDSAMTTANRVLTLEDTLGESSSSRQIPLEWYKDTSHIGYTRDGKRLLKRHSNRPSQPVTVKNGVYHLYDEKNDEDIALSRNELKKLVNIVRLQNPSGISNSGFVGEEVVSWTGKPRLQPVREPNVSKRAFLPSSHEAAQVIRLVRAIRQRNKIQSEKSLETTNIEESIWEKDASPDISRSIRRYIQPPKKSLPGHQESYRPPLEYLPSKEELEKSRREGERGRFLPQSYEALRHVPIYTNLVREIFERCVELYLAPRVRKLKSQIDLQSLLPKLPSPEDLKPFPDTQVSFLGPHQSAVLSVSVNATGQWLACSCLDGYLYIWEIASGICRRKINLAEKIKSFYDSENTALSEEYSTNSSANSILHIQWCPRKDNLILAACIDRFVVIINAFNLLHPSATMQRESLSPWFGHLSSTTNQTDSQPYKWKSIQDDADVLGSTILVIEHPRNTQRLHWHQKGDYFAVVIRDAFGSSLAVHQLSKMQSQSPFSKSVKSIQLAEFHPSKPYLFIATKHRVHIYNLSNAKLMKKLLTGVAQVSAMCVHPSGDHLLIGSSEGHLMWFDLDLSSRPYKKLRDHSYSVRTIACHNKLPLFADASDDHSIAIFHATVYEDLLQNPLIVPLKILKNYHKSSEFQSVSDICWHPELPWLFSCGFDGYVRLFAPGD
eukprot:jgi/Galph1/337/GphlegSOOS_G5090.1